MKTKICFLMLGFMSLLLSFQANAIAISPALISQGGPGKEPKVLSVHPMVVRENLPEDRWWFFFGVKFGRRSRDCNGFGVCDWMFDIVEDGFVPQPGAGLVKGTKVNDGELSFNFPKSGLVSATMMQYFSGSNFLVEEPIELPKEIAQKFGVSTFTIKAGSYPILKTNESFTVNFKR